MKFMLMMHGSRAGFEALAKWKPEEFHAHIRFMLDLNAKLTSSGELVLAEGLDVPHNVKVVRAEAANAPLVSDGPFAETKEFLVGFWIVDCASAQRAHEIAAMASVAPGPGGKPLAIPIEVRQVMSAPPIDG